MLNRFNLLYIVFDCLVSDINKLWWTQITKLEQDLSKKTHKYKILKGTDHNCLNPR